MTDPTETLRARVTEYLELCETVWVKDPPGYFDTEQLVRDLLQALTDAKQERDDRIQPLVEDADPEIAETLRARKREPSTEWVLRQAELWFIGKAETTTEAIVSHLRHRLSTASQRADAAEQALTDAEARVFRIHDDSDGAPCEHDQAGGPSCVRENHHRPVTYDDWMGHTRARWAAEARVAALEQERASQRRQDALTALEQARYDPRMPYRPILCTTCQQTHNPWENCPVGRDTI